jgi:hypothetical protein
MINPFTGPNDTYLPSLRPDDGHLIITPPAGDLMRGHSIDPHRLLERHRSGDWGDQSDGDKKAWDRALESGASSLMSVYNFGGEEVWLLTDVERFVTAFLVPEEPY